MLLLFGGTANGEVGTELAPGPSQPPFQASLDVTSQGRRSGEQKGAVTSFRDPPGCVQHLPPTPTSTQGLAPSGCGEAVRPRVCPHDPSEPVNGGAGAWPTWQRLLENAFLLESVLAFIR